MILRTYLIKYPFNLMPTPNKDRAAMRNYYLSLLILCCIFLPFASIAVDRETTASPRFEYYTQIPGVTDEEIKAIEDLKKKRQVFSYGMNKTTKTFLTNNNTVDGFTRLFSERLSELFGIKFIPAIYGWDELNAKMEALALDFTGELTATQERKQRYFMTEPIFSRIISIFTNQDNPSLEATAKERPLNFGFLKTSMTYDLVKESLPVSSAVYFLDNEEQALSFLKDGELDAYIDVNSASSIFENAAFVKEADYYPLRYLAWSFATATPELRPIINVVQKYLQNGGLNEVAAMHKDGESKYAAYRVAKLFTDEEKSYIASHLTSETALLVGYEVSNYPVAFYNQEEKSFQGIAMDVLEEVTSLTGLRFKVANTPESTWAELLTRLAKGEISLVSELIASKNRSGKFIWTNNRYNSGHYILLSLADYNDININHVLNIKVGLVALTAAADVFREWFPTSKNHVVFVDYTEAFSALENGDIDLLMGTNTTLLTLTNYLEKLDFKVNITFNHPADSYFGLNKNETVLRSILDKTLPFVDTEEISEHWKRKVFDYDSKMFKDMMPYLFTALGLLGVGLATVCVLLVKNWRMSRHLEATVVKRTRQLEYASRAKSDFLSNMSHEMRTPLNAVIGMAKIAETTDNISRLRYCLSVIGASSAYLLNLINDILDMAKIEAGKLELHDASLNIEKMLIQVCNMIFAKTEEKMQTLSITIDKNLHLDYTGDELRLSQVVTNLLSNALKFTPEGGTIAVSVREKAQKRGRSVLCFSVADNGIGMTQEQGDRLFQAFSQADGGIAKRFGGTGLGLAISKSIVEKMNGRIWVKSEPDKGATFLFEVELERRDVSESQAGLGGRPPEELRVLVVDGNTVLRKGLCGIVGQFNMQCRAAAGCDEAVAEIQSAVAAKMPYDVIFVSYASLGDDCVESIQQANAMTNSGVVIVMASLSEWSQLEAAVGNMGVHRVLFKPVFPSAVLQAIGDVLDNAVSPVEAAPFGAGETPDFSDITLLLVEDVEINREIFITLLEDTGIRIEIAENGLEAVEKFGNDPEKYSIIVMDVQMPVMDGYEATRTIRSLSVPNAGTVPILAMTANVLSEDVDNCLKSGMNDHTIKPINVNDLMEKIWTLTKKISSTH